MAKGIRVPVRLNVRDQQIQTSQSEESTDRLEVIIHFGEKEGLGEGTRKTRERE